jgi:IS30 family transposase
MGDLSNFEREQIVGVHSSGASVSETATALCPARATVSKIILEYEDNISKEGAVGENQH